MNRETPIPDPPPATPLTAEQIAVMQGFATTWQKMGGRAVNAQLAGQCLGDTLDSHAALRDRLARAEATLEDAHSTLYVLSQMAHNWANMGTAEEYKAMVDVNVVRASRMRKRIHALLASPTDGAARAGDAAKGATT